MVQEKKIYTKLHYPSSFTFSSESIQSYKDALFQYALKTVEAAFNRAYYEYGGEYILFFLFEPQTKIK